MKKRILLILATVIVLGIAAMLLFACDLFGGNNRDWDGKKVQLSSDYLQGEFSDGLRGYLYNSKPITVEDDILIFKPDYREMASNDLFDFEYKNNVNVGTATVTVTAKPDNEYFYGSLDLDFYIHQSALGVNSLDDLVRELNGDNVYMLSAGFDIDFADADITIKEGVTLRLFSTNETVNVELSGKLTNNGTIEFTNSGNYNYGIELFNNGTVINNGDITLSGHNNKIYNSGNFDNENGKIIVASINYFSVIFSNDEEIPNIFDDKGNIKEAYTQRVRSRITEDDLKMEYTSVFFNKTQAKYEPTITSSKDIFIYFKTEYLDSTCAGTATAHVTVNRTDMNYYGELDLKYTIEKGAVDVSSVSELNEYQSTGNYGYFYADTFKVEEGETLRIEEGNELNVLTLYVYGTLKNYGYTKVYSNPTGSYFEGNCYINDSNGGAGRLENYGEFLTEEFALCRDGTVINSGKIAVSKSTSIQSKLVNLEDGIADFKGYIYIYSEIENSGEIKMEPTNYVKFYSLNVKNGGKFLIDGETVIKELAQFENSGEFSNENGSAWTYVNLPSDFKNIVLKRQITEQDIVFDGYPVYNGSMQRPVFAASTNLRPEQYAVMYKYEGESDYVLTAPVNAGKMSLLIRIADELTIYYADEKGILVDIPYEILHAEIGVSTAQELHDYAKNTNYSRVYLNNDIEFSYVNVGGAIPTSSVTRTFTVAAGVTLDTNGHTLTMLYPTSTGKNGVGDPTIYNYGTILNSKDGEYGAGFKPTEEDCGIYLKQSNIYNYGTIVNHNVFFADSRSTLSERDNSKIENHGLMYLVGALKNSEIIDEGLIFERENLNGLRDNKERVELEYWETDYDGTEKNPWVKLYGKSMDEVDLSDENRFAINRENVVSYRRCYVSLTALDEFDEEFAGTWYAYIKINKSVAKIIDIDGLVDATNDSNYIGYEIVGSDVWLSKNVVLPAGTFLDLGIYGFSRYYDGCTVDFSAGAELLVSVGSAERLQKYLYCADKITIIGDIESEEEISVRLKSADMGLTVGNGNALKKQYGGVTVDLNGHYIGGRLNFICDYNPNLNGEYYTLNIVDTSEEKTGRLGSGKTVHGLHVSGQTAINVNLKDVTVGGLELDYTVYFKAEDCTFETTAAEGNVRAAYYCASSWNNNVQAVFKHCTLSGAVGAYLGRARHIFVSCEINANGAYSGEGDWGSAVVIVGHNARVGIDMGNFHSENGYCVELIGLYESNKPNVEITARTNTDSEAGNDSTGRWSCAKSTKVSEPTLYTDVEQLSYFDMKKDLVV